MGRKNALPVGHDVGFTEERNGQARFTVRKHDFQTLTRASLPASDSLVGVNLDADNIGHQGDFSVND